jgi:hypothetical protein
MIKTYKINYNNDMILCSNGNWIPPDNANTDYQQYLAWVAEGNVAEEWNPND